MSNELEVMQLRARVMELEGKIEFIYKHLNLEYKREANIEEQKILEALKKGGIMEAIKVYREIYHVDLASAKLAVEEMARRP
jgi:hypothetical protein